MLKRKIFKIVIVLFLVNGCSSQSNSPGSSNNNSDVPIRVIQLRKFLNKIPVLPNAESVISFDYPPLNDLVSLDENSSDTLFVGYPTRAKIFGLLPDTVDFYPILWFADVENGALTLTTLAKDGNIINEKQLSTGLYASGGCGYQWHGQVYLKKELSFLMRDSIITFNCDTGPAPPDKWRHEIATMNAKVNANGKIEFSKLYRKIVKE